MCRFEVNYFFILSVLPRLCNRVAKLHCSGGSTIYRSKHWAFADADLCCGDVIGGSVPLIGSGVDGVDNTFRYGLPCPPGEDGGPMNLAIPAKFVRECSRLQHEERAGRDVLRRNPQK